MKPTAIINGWEVNQQRDGSYVVADTHGALAGPYPRSDDAFRAALSLPPNLGSIQQRRSLTAGLEGLGTISVPSH